MCCNLKQCGATAKERQLNLKRHGITTSLQNLLTNAWRIIYPNCNLPGKNLTSRLYAINHKSGLQIAPVEIDVLATDTQDDQIPPGQKEKESSEQEKSPDLTNITQDQAAMAQAAMKQGETHARKPLFNGICYSCGMLLYGTVGHGNRFYYNDPALENAPVVQNMKGFPFPLPHKIGNVFLSCSTCKKGPQALYPCTNPENGDYIIPEPVKALRNDYEKGQVALAGLFSSTLKKPDRRRRIWMHKVGEVNILAKLQRHYEGMYGFLVDQNPPAPDETSEGRIRQALFCLRQVNPLYRDFIANYETLYRYTLPRAMATGVNLEDSKGKPIESHLGSEPAGLAVPLENNITAQISESEDRAGIQHDIRPRAPQEKIAYRDPNLEAKAWPCLFPFGTGSWIDRSVLTMQPYVKNRLLNVDPRWRNNNEWSFFWTDRMLKTRLLYHAKSRKANVEGIPSGLTAGDVAHENVYDRYGTDVPNTSTGSLSYWRSRNLDLFAMSDELGPPTFFITITQNDNWEEAQTIVRCRVGMTMDEMYDILTSPPEPCTDIPTEMVVAFNERLRLFRKVFFNNPNGPLGLILDHWGRKELQGRGALHLHMVTWNDLATVPKDAIRAELPRASIDCPETKRMRDFVKKFQIHECRPERCFKNCKAGQEPVCKYGFPFETQAEEQLDPSGVRFLYVRHHKEDSKVVPFNLSLLLLFQAHVNVQRISSAGWVVYLAKYVSKPEPSFDIQLSPNASDVERFLRTRVIGRLEADNLHLGFELSRGSREVIFLPTDLKPTYRFIKRNAHMPQDQESTNIFYDTKLDKFFDRPEALADVNYPDYYRKFRIGKASEDERVDDCDAPGNADPQEQQTYTDLNGRTVTRRKKQAVVRWRFLLPHGNDQEKHFEQKLLLNVPFTQQTVADIISPQNQSKTYMEECVIRKLLVEKEEDAVMMLKNADARGFDIKDIQRIAQEMVDANWLSESSMEETLAIIVETRPILEEESAEVADGNFGEDAEMGDLTTRTSKVNLGNMRASLNQDQTKALDLLLKQLPDGKQITISIVGAAGTGKSYLLKTFVAHAQKQANLTVQKLATTGVAAHLIGGMTVHNFLRMDIEGKTYLEKGTVRYNFVRDCQMIVIDEFSLLESKVFRILDETLRDMALGGNAYKPFGGKHIVLLGDPAQLPAIGHDIFGTATWQNFDAILLEQVMRQDDNQFVKLLHEIRFGRPSQASLDTLQTRVTDDNPTHPDQINKKSAIIVSLRIERDAANEKILQNLEGEERVYEAEDTDALGNPISDIDKENIKRFQRQRFPDCLRLKPHARVVLLKNMDVANGWVNGTLASVVTLGDDFIIIESNSSGKRIVIHPVKQNVGYEHSNSLHIRRQFPLCLGWALTVHKVQGMTLETAYVLLNSNFFASGQAYTALSRVKSIDNLHLLAFEPSAIRLDTSHRNVLAFLSEINLLQTESPLERTKVDVETRRDFNFPKHADSCPKHKNSSWKPEEKPSKLSPPMETLTVYPEEEDEEVNSWKTALTKVICGHEFIVPNPIEISSFPIGPPQVQHMLHARHLILDGIRGDGNCFYRCLSKDLFGQEDLHLVLRIKTMTFVEGHYDEFEALINVDKEQSNRVALHREQYFESQRKSGEWSGSTDAYGLASMLGIQLEVLHQNHNGIWNWKIIHPITEFGMHDVPAVPEGYRPVIYNESQDGEGQHFTRCTKCFIEN